MEKYTKGQWKVSFLTRSGEGFLSSMMTLYKVVIRQTDNPLSGVKSHFSTYCIYSFLNFKEYPPRLAL